MLMFFFFNDDKLKETLEAKETNREIEVSAEEEPCEIVKNIFNEPHPTDSPRRMSLTQIAARYEKETQERIRACSTQVKTLQKELAEARARLRKLEERNALLEAEHERHKNSLVCLTDRLADLERENARLRDAIGHFYGECAELVQGTATATAPTVVAQHHYYPGSLHVSGSHLPDAHFNPAPTGHELSRK